MDTYLLGIDNGATVSKVVIFDLAGQVIGRASAKAEAKYPHPGWTERALDALWHSTTSAIRTALDTAGIEPHRVAAIGTCGHGNGMYLLDRHGAPLRPGMLSMDKRAAAIVADWMAHGVLNHVRPFIHQTPYAGQPPALLRWLKLHEPEVYARIGAVLMVKDYVKYQLTGTISTDPSDMSETGLFDLHQRNYTPALLDAFGITEIAAALPPIVASAAPAGYVTAEAARLTGLRAGTPVVGGLLDVNAGTLGAGVIAPGQACSSAGTWAVTSVVARAPSEGQDYQLFNAIYTPDTWLTFAANPISTTNLEWFVTEFCAEERAEARARGVSVYEICDEKVAACSPAGTSILFHPFLYGSNVQPTARAGFYGLAGWHTRTDLLRALYEGVAYGHRSQIEQLRDGGVQIESLRLIGGGARSAVWAQIFADVIGLPLAVPHGSEIGARGAALNAGIGAGVYADYADAIAQTVTIERTYQPNAAATERYQAAYDEYWEIAEGMQEPWKGLQGLER